MAGGKDTTNVQQVVHPLSLEILESRLLARGVPRGPRDDGKVSLIVERPSINQRNIVPETQLDIEKGMANSGWKEQEGRGKDDQICVMSTIAIRAISDTDEPEYWAPAGDQMFFDFDLTGDFLRTGDMLEVGECLLRVTDKPHTGCAKFAKRYGVNALKIVTGPIARHLRLRGIYFSVAKGGTVRVGDTINRLRKLPE